MLTLDEAVFGVTREIKIPTLVSCKTCSGSGSKDNGKTIQCRTCHGAGQVRMQHGFLAIAQTCSTCQGSGRVIENPCIVCHGQGRVQDRKTLSVKIPAGIDDGDRVRLAGEGEAGVHGAPAGDLYVQVRVKPHQVFTRHGNDLHVEIPLDFVTAAIGGEVTVPTMDNEVKLSIPPETQSGKTFRLRGKGVKALRSGAVGDLLCKIYLETPVKLTPEQKELLKQFQTMLEAGGKRHSPKQKGWFDSVKEFFKK